VCVCVCVCVRQVLLSQMLVVVLRGSVTNEKWPFLSHTFLRYHLCVEFIQPRGPSRYRADVGVAVKHK